MKTKKLKAPEMALVLRTCHADLTSHGRFQWPNEVGAVVAAPDWRRDDECGHGLHGWLFGQGDSGASDSIGATDAKWLVVEVVLSDIVALGGKVKFPSCTIRHIGDKHSATEYLLANEPRAASVAVIGATLTGGDDSTLTGGDDSTLTGGYGSTLTGGYGSTLTGGNRSTLTGGDDSTLTGGYGSTLTGGDDSTLTGGNRSTLTGGNRSTLTGGNRSTLTGGYGSTLTGGNRSTLTGGTKSELRIRKWCSKAERYRTYNAYVGEDGIEADVAYRLDDNNKFVKA
ncbi:Phage flagellar hook-length control protein fliK [Pseudomonas chlororaphis subsp. aureofaciens]|nr:Phage flagellar hook-length control protein fliK [Pseudomonas chlororaphis subsp. aureofaciens]